MTAGDPAADAPAEGARKLDAAAAAAFESCVARGGVAVFPADTVYGLATDPGAEVGFERLYALKRRRPDMPSAVMLFSIVAALDALPELGTRTRTAFERLLPGPLTLIVPNPARRFPLACGPTPERLGVRVPALDGPLEPLRAVARPVVQSSANLHGGADPRRLADVPDEIRAGADLVLDGGELPGTASTVVDLGDYEAGGRYEVLREGAVPAAELARRL